MENNGGGGEERIRDRNNRPGLTTLNYDNVGINMIGFSLLLLLVTDCSLVSHDDDDDGTLDRWYNKTTAPHRRQCIYLYKGGSYFEFFRNVMFPKPTTVLISTSILTTNPILKFWQIGIYF